MSSQTDTSTLDERLFDASIASLELLSIHLGRRLGLYATIAATPDGVTHDELATHAGIAPRYAREWLEQQAVAGFVTVDHTDAPAATQRFSLDHKQRSTFVDAEDPAHLAPLADLLAGIGSVLDLIVDAYRAGTGVSYATYGPHLRNGQGDLNRPTFTHALSGWLAATTIGRRLAAAGTSARIADVGCGQGWSTIALARAFPDADVVGFDADTASIDDARERAAHAAAPVTFEARLAEDLATAGPFDLIVLLETLHDMCHPDAALAACRAALRRDGAVVLADEKVAPTFSAPGDATERFMYGFSVLHCLPASMTEPDSAALGTVLRSSTVHHLAATAGFDQCREVDVDAGFFQIYELSP